eukprot:7064802-Prymnesium_polylepis.1
MLLSPSARVGLRAPDEAAQLTLSHDALLWPPPKKDCEKAPPGFEPPTFAVWCLQSDANHHTIRDRSNV